MDIDQILDNVHPLPNSSKELIKSLFTESSYPKGYHLFFNDQPVKYLYFLKDGICRAYTNSSEKQLTYWFGTPGNIIFPLQTLYEASGLYESLELLSDCYFYKIRIEDLHELFNMDIHIANWGRISAEKELLKIEKELINRLFKTALERYEDLRTTYPEIVKQVPSNIISTYLGITSVSLSRIRGQIRK